MDLTCKDGGDRCWCEVCLGRLWMCFNRESDGREKWRFGLDDKNIYTVVRDCDRKIKSTYFHSVISLSTSCVLLSLI